MRDRSPDDRQVGEVIHTGDDAANGLRVLQIGSYIFSLEKDLDLPVFSDENTSDVPIIPALSPRPGAVPFPDAPRILVVGAGAVGGFFGALFCKAGFDVTFLLRPATHAHIEGNGLTIVSVDPALGRFTVHPRCVQAATDAGQADIILLAVKCYDLTAALSAIAPQVLGDRDVSILPLQNGVGGEERIASYFTQNARVGGMSGVIGGVAYITSRLAAPGVVEHFRRGIIAVGALSDRQDARVAWIQKIFSQANIECRVSRNIRKTQWEKLCWNATLNPFSVILDCQISFVLDSPQWLEVVRRGIKEVIDVATAEGVPLDADISEQTIRSSETFRDFHTSMYEDIHNGRPTEIDALNGDLIRRGKRHGIPTPTHDRFYAEVTALDAKRRTA